MMYTPLSDVEKLYGANFGYFAGWITPLDFGNAIDECVATRTSVTVFDVSHMGRFVVRGSKSYEFLEKIVTKDLSKLRDGDMSGPALILNEYGGIKDDVMLYRVNEDKWFIVCNAVNREKDLNWLLTWRGRLGFTNVDVDIDDVTTKTTLIAVQGPKSLDLLESIGFKDLSALKLLNFMLDTFIGEISISIVSRSGWTGEEVRSYGFELLADINNGIKIYEALIKAGAKPAGLIARDTLRLEMGYVLYGNDIDENVNPIEARYWVALSKGKDECIGCDNVWQTYRGGVSKLRVGFKLKKDVKSIPRKGYKIMSDDEVVGEVTSGAFSPTANRSIGMGYVKVTHAYLGFNLSILIRNTKYEVKITDFPLI